jgi:hypothetical protein
MKNLALMLSAGLLLVASNAAADGYGSAGCGLGSMIFGPGNGFVQVFASTTNGSSGTQTFGISSGTSNCDKSGGGAENTKSFVATNRSALAKDIARGKGETITNLSALAGCGDAKAVGKKLQRKFKVIFPSSTVSDEIVGESVVEVLRSEQALSCSNLG